MHLAARWKSHLLDKSGRRGFTGGHVGRYKDGDGDFVGEFLHGERNGNPAVAMADQNNLFISGKRGHEVEERFHVLEHGGDLVDLFPGGKVVTITVVHNGDPNPAAGPELERPSSEHHEDPPGAFDEEGDVIMDVDLQPKAGVDDGGCDSPSV
nr:uncharacterized protein LOC109167844 [Ipomoea batatas]